MAAVKKNKNTHAHTHTQVAQLVYELIGPLRGGALLLQAGWASDPHPVCEFGAFVAHLNTRHKKTDSEKRA